MAAPTTDYHLGTSDEELHRLGYQHQVWQDVTQSLWQKAGFGQGQRILDLGCGPGFATMELARLVGPAGLVHAIDAADTFLQPLKQGLSAARLHQVQVQKGDAHQIPLADQSVDGVFVRWLLCFVTDPARVCQEIARVLRPGGTLVAWDYYNYLSANVFPLRPEISRLFQAYYQSAILHHGSYDIAAELPGMMLEAGLELVDLHPINRAGRPGSATWKWVSMFHHSYLPKLIESDLLTEVEAENIRLAWQQAENDPGSFFSSPPMLGIIARKPA
jgi:ubiquinone/menaquinone biosynthesis C-methylase UbiE